jgi:hypothetical protein
MNQNLLDCYGPTCLAKPSFFLLGPNFLQFPKKFRTDAHPSHLDIHKIQSAKKFNNFIIIIIIG